jgi:hypothetical protein
VWYARPVAHSSSGHPLFPTPVVQSSSSRVLFPSPIAQSSSSHALFPSHIVCNETKSNMCDIGLCDARFLAKYTLVDRVLRSYYSQLTYGSLPRLISTILHIITH